MLLRLHIAVVVCILLSACGGNSNSEIGFINQTEHSDAQLWNLWRAAQQALSHQVDLNPIQQQLSNAAPQLLPGNAKAWRVLPRQVTVAPQADVSSAALFAATGTRHPDPTGLVQCPQPCNVRYAPAYSVYILPATRYAASWEFAGNNFDLLVQYEFENQILSVLGYDLRWR